LWLQKTLSSSSWQNKAKFASDFNSPATVCQRNPHLFQRALAVAECFLLLRDVRDARLAAIQRRLDSKTTMSANEDGAGLQERREAQAFYQAMPDLAKLERYERRAWSRQKRARRHFAEMKPSVHNPQEITAASAAKIRSWQNEPNGM
jgi:hypothetical protein